MSAVAPLLLRPAFAGWRPLLNLSLMLSLSTSPFFISSSLAEDADRRSYQVPAGSLGVA